MPMMIKGTILAAFLVLIWGCGSSGANEGTTGATTDESGAQIYAQITETDPYTEWEQFSEAIGTIESSAPHGPFARVYINDIAAAALDSSPENLPNGSIIVKDSIDTADAQDMGTLTIMKKIEGFRPRTNDWFWVMVSSNGEVQGEGNIGMCISCHLSQANNDYIFLHQLQ
ncbi:MAG: cytochrome P460 family protein [Deltaproteobacteria bacterium]|nr:cytochrome P460 family protein [Deltaproteobacteria bacterium]